MDNQTLIVVALVSIFIVLFVFFVFSNLSDENSAFKKKILDEIKRNASGVTTADLMTLKQKLIEADKLLDHALRFKGTKGNSLGDRLKRARNFFNRNEYNNVWEAHKLRNRVVHEFSYNAKKSEVRHAINTLNKASRGLLK